jgi:hypothetical protein
VAKLAGRCVLCVAMFAGRWFAKLIVRWVAKLIGRWVAKLFREMGG